MTYCAVAAATEWRPTRPKRDVTAPFIGAAVSRVTRARGHESGIYAYDVAVVTGVL